MFQRLKKWLAGPPTPQFGGVYKVKSGFYKGSKAHVLGPPDALNQILVRIYKDDLVRSVYMSYKDLDIPITN